MTPQPFSTDPMLTNTIGSRQSATMGKFFTREIDYRITNIYRYQNPSESLNYAYLPQNMPLAIVPTVRP